MSTNHVQQATIQAFERLMAAVGNAIHDAVGNNPDPDRLSKIEVHIEAVIREVEAGGFTHPPKVLSDLLQALETFRTAPQQLATQHHPIGHRLIWYLLCRYQDYLTATVGADETDRCLIELFSAFQRKPGRPAELPLATLMTIKKLRDAGKSYGEVGILVNLTRQQVRSALCYHYPEKKPG